MELTISQRLLWTAAALIVVVVLFISLKPILMPFILAAMFAYLLDPVTDILERRMNRTAAVCVVFFFLTFIFTLVLLLLIPMLVDQLGSFIQRIPATIEWIQRSILPYLHEKTGLEFEGLPLSDIQQLFSQYWQQASGVAGSVLKTATSSTVSAVLVVVNLMLVPVVTFYLLRDWDKLIASISLLVPHQIRPRVNALARECDEVLSAFIHGQLLVMLALGSIYAVGLAIVGVELALFLGALAGLASVVPYLGVVVGILAATIAAWMQFHDWMPLIWVALVFGIGQVLESVVLTPLLVGDKIGLHPVAVIFAIMAGGQLAGFVGVLVALPVAAVLMVFVRHVHTHYQNSAWYLKIDE